MSQHPARRARTVTALVSAAAFAGIVSGLIATHGAASAPAPSAGSSPSTSPAAGPSNSANSTSPGDTGWAGTPAPSGSLSHPGPDHGQSGAS